MLSGFYTNGFVLAGGASSRMGVDKSLLAIAGEPLILRTVRLVKSLTKRVAVIGDPEKYAKLGIDTIPDKDFGLGNEDGRSKGPLCGIATALSSSDAGWNLILACDLPYLTSGWIEWLHARALRSRAQVVIPKAARGLEPLAAVYRKECATALEQELRRGVRKVTEALNALELEEVGESQWAQIDSTGRVLRNMNTPADYEEARAWWESGRLP